MTITQRKFCFVGDRWKITSIEHAAPDIWALDDRTLCFQDRSMRSLFVLLMTFASLSLAGCASVPNDPTLTLQTSKTPAQYAECVVPKLQGSALNPMVSQTQRSYRIVVPSKVSADNVLEAYKSGNGGKVFIYERHLLASNLLPSSFGRAAQDCI